MNQLKESFDAQRKRDFTSRIIRRDEDRSPAPAGHAVQHVPFLPRMRGVIGLGSMRKALDLTVVSDNNRFHT